MPTKKANGEGSIQKYYKDDVLKGWRATLTIGRDSDGKLLRKQFYGKTKVETLDKMNEYKIRYNTGQLEHDNNMTFAQWFYTWLFEFRINDLKPSSFERYEGIYRNYVKNLPLGNKKLSDLRASHIQSHYNTLISEGKPVSTIKNINGFIFTCLAEAVKQRYIYQNPCDSIKLPKEAITEKEDIVVLDIEEQKTFIEAIKGHNLEMLFMFDLATGLRLGELLALRWDDINIKDKVVKINKSIKKVTYIDKEDKRTSKVIEQTPKTKTSYRTVPIPKNVFDMLMIYKGQQDIEKGKNAEAYNNQGFVFCNSLGFPIESKQPGRNLKSILIKVKIKPLKFHSLRHTYATRLFEAGVPIKTVQALMGHSDIATTMNIYTHVTREKKIEASEILNKIFE